MVSSTTALLDMVLGTTACVFQLISLSLFFIFPSLRGNAVSHVLLYLFIAQAIQNAVPLFAYYGYDRIGDDQSILCRLQSSLCIFGIEASSLWNSIFALHVMICIRYPAMAVTAWLWRSYHIVAWLLASAITAFSLFTNVTGHRGTGASCTFHSLPETGYWYSLPLMGGIVISVVVALVSLVIIALEVSKQEAIPTLWLKLAVVLRTTSFVIFFLLYAGWILYTFYADTPFHNLKTVAASYGILNAIVWWASKAVAEAYEQKRLRSVSTAFEANNSVWSAPLVDSEKPLRDSVSDYSLMDGNPSNADTYLSRPSNGRSVYSSSSRGDSVSLEDDFSTPSRPVSLASSSSPFQSGSYRNQLSPRLYGSPRR